MGGHNNWPYIINLGNSIIGVAVLAMPFCFKQCGIILGMLVLLFCTWLTLSSSQMLMKAGIESRRRSYEFLAFHTHGATGKLVSEIGMIGMQLGTLIAQIVVIGDLGPAIISKVFGIENSSGLRTFLIMVLCLTVGLPLGLLKNLRTVSRASTVCISFYCVFVFYVISMSLPNLVSGSWYPYVNFWRPQGLFQCLPILSFSFGCQTQLFLVYDALPEPSLKSMNGVISSAVNLCAVAYLLVGFFGYIAFYSVDIPGDVIAIFPSTFVSDMMKLCFVFSIVITFPVIIFPCRASIYTLIFAKTKSKHQEEVIENDGFIPENIFKTITTLIVMGSMVTGILIPNVEFILGMNGAITGTLICYIFPALFFLQVRGGNSDGRKLAKTVLFLGITILVVSTYATLSSQETHKSIVFNPEDGPADKPDNIMKPDDIINPVEKKKIGDEEIMKKVDDLAVQEEIRKEPPNPNPPDAKKDVIDDVKAGLKDEDSKIIKKDVLLESNVLKKSNLSEQVKESLVAHLQKAEDSEKEAKRDEVLAKLEQQQKEQAKILEEQREVLKELKIHHDKDVEKEEIQEADSVIELDKKIIDEGLQKTAKPRGLDEGFVKKEEKLLHAPLAGVNPPEDSHKIAMNLQPPGEAVGAINNQNLNIKAPAHLEPVLPKDPVLSDNFVKKESEHVKADKYNIERPNGLEKQQLHQPAVRYHSEPVLKDEAVLHKKDLPRGALRQKRDLIEDDVQVANNLDTQKRTAGLLIKPMQVMDIKSNISAKEFAQEEIKQNEEMRRRLKNVEETEVYNNHTRK